MAESEDRTLPATERRRQQARAEGQAPLSREVVAASGLAAMALIIAMLAPSMAMTLQHQLQAMLANPAADPGVALRNAGLLLLRIVLPIAGSVLLASSAAVLLQTGWLFHGKAVLPDLARLDPRKGLKRVFGGGNAVEAVKALAKVAVLGWAVWHVLSGTLATTSATLSWTLQATLDQLTRDTLHVLLVVLACQCAIALLDTGWMRFRFARQLRMSLEEIKQEHKETEGDPRLKAKLRQMRLVRARRRMIAAVANATVVVTNPTHYAVALTYDAAVAPHRKSWPKASTNLPPAFARRPRNMASRCSPALPWRVRCICFRSTPKCQPNTSKPSPKLSPMSGASAGQLAAPTPCRPDRRR